jgi:putative FmdB family regulatory protein
MPIYTYQCKTCEFVHEESLKISERDEPLTKACVKCGGSIHERIIVSAPLMGDPVRLGFRKPDSSIKEALSRTHEKTPGSQLKKHSNLSQI